MARGEGEGKVGATRRDASRPMWVDGEGRAQPAEAAEAFVAAIDELTPRGAAEVLGVSRSRVYQLRGKPWTASREQYDALTAAALGKAASAQSRSWERAVNIIAEEAAARANRVTLAAQIAGVLLTCGEEQARAIASAAVLAMRAEECECRESACSDRVVADDGRDNGVRELEEASVASLHRAVYDVTHETFRALVDGLICGEEQQSVPSFADSPEEMLHALARASRGEIHTLPAAEFGHISLAGYSFDASVLSKISPEYERAEDEAAEAGGQSGGERYSVAGRIFLDLLAQSFGEARAITRRAQRGDDGGRRLSEEHITLEDFMNLLNHLGERARKRAGRRAAVGDVAR